jgi:H+/Cl- antiporter ClcA
MTPEAFLIAVAVAYLLGGIASVLIPFARKYFEGVAAKFEWRKAGGRILVLLGGLAPTLLGGAKLAEFQEFAEQGWYGVVFAFITAVVAFGLSSLGHQAQGTPKALKARKQ